MTDPDNTVEGPTSAVVEDCAEQLTEWFHQSVNDEKFVDGVMELLNQVFEEAQGDPVEVNFKVTATIAIDVDGEPASEYRISGGARMKARAERIQ